MDVILFLLFLFFISDAVWRGTQRRFGTLDEARALAGVVIAVTIIGLAASL